MMVDNYDNVYWIDINDRTDSVDNSIHNSIKQLVRQSIVMLFILYFDGSLRDNNDGLRLMKEYN